MNGYLMKESRKGVIISRREGRGEEGRGGTGREERKIGSEV